MKKENRLLKNRDFKYVLDGKNSVSCGEFVIFQRKNHVNHARIGISVSSKIGNSVVRHKIKRQITEMIRKMFDFNNNLDVVIIVRNGFLYNDYSKNETKLKKMLERGK